MPRTSKRRKFYFIPIVLCLLGLGAIGWSRMMVRQGDHTTVTANSGNMSYVLTYSPAHPEVGQEVHFTLKMTPASDFDLNWQAQQYLAEAAYVGPNHIAGALPVDFGFVSASGQAQTNYAFQSTAGNLDLEVTLPSAGGSVADSVTLPFQVYERPLAPTNVALLGWAAVIGGLAWLLFMIQSAFRTSHQRP